MREEWSPVGAEHHRRARMGSMAHGLADGPARRRVPEARRILMPTGEDGLAIGAERHRGAYLSLIMG